MTLALFEGPRYVGNKLQIVLLCFLLTKVI